MTSMKTDIVHSPVHPDRFITVGNDLHLYQIEEINPEKQSYPVGGIKISEKTVAVSVAINNEHTYMKCMAWYPKPEPENLLAVGQTNGKIILTSFGHVEDPLHLIGREFVPRHPRHCNCIAWNPVESHLLASGLDKGRSDPALLIWDVLKPPCPTLGMHNSEKRHMVGGIKASQHDVPTISTVRPVLELGMSETVHSLHWFQHQPKMIVCGMNNKHLKIFDLRDSSKPHNVTATKAVNGICVDPLCENRLASFIESQIVLWDIRNFEKPVIYLPEARQVIKIAWCPTRAGLLSTLTRDSSMVRLYDFQQASLGNEEIEPTVIERSIQPCGNDIVSSFAWHTTRENRLLAITPSENIYDYTVFDRTTLNWSPTSEIVWTHGRKILHCIDHRDKLYDLLDDVSIKMRRRALAGYGLKSEQLWQNGKIADDDPSLQSLWTWLDLVKSLKEDGTLKSGKDVSFVGVQSLIQGDVEGNGLAVNKTEPVLLSWSDVDGSYVGISTFLPVYQNEDRQKALQLCGWGGFPSMDDANLDALLIRLENDHQYIRAAAIALFNLRIHRAISILSQVNKISVTDGVDGNLNVVAMALSGYTEDRNTLWQQMCLSLKQQLHNPYLHAMFSFLTCNGDYKEILSDQHITVQDRVAFACIYLPDDKLGKYLDTLTSQLIEIGDLSGFLLTGLSSDGLNLLQQYVDTTGDVQTATLVVLQGLPSEICQDERALCWVDAYRELLDRWRLWHQRALFDVQWNKRNPAEKPRQQIFISCNFCGKSVSSYLQTIGLVTGPRELGRFSAANKFKQDQLTSDMHSQPRSRKQSFVMNKVTSCPSCRKPLPRCSLCLNNMGTSSGAYWKRPGCDKNAHMQEEKLTKFSGWFTWCQTCRHGGHAMHLMDWFKEHSECPVTACTCKCMSLDTVARKGKPANEALL